MPRVKDSGRFGPVRSLRLPLSLEHWLHERLMERNDISTSRVLLELIHGGLRLVPGYLARHRDALHVLREREENEKADAYIMALRHSFGDAYVYHLERWLESSAPRIAQQIPRK